MRFLTDKSELRKYAPIHRAWQGIPSLERTAGGRLFSCFYSGNGKETFGNFVVLLCSDDDGKTWIDPVAVATGDWEQARGADSRCYDAELWCDPLGRLWFTWSYTEDAFEPEKHFYKCVWGAICDDPDAETIVWSEPFKVGHNVMMCKPTVLSTGEWLFPLSVWRGDYGLPTGATCCVSTDNGKTITRIGEAVAEKRTFDEHMFYERRDGTVVMLIRTLQPHGIDVSYSSDKGKTWSVPVKYGLDAPCSRFFVRRLRSGRLLLVSNDDPKIRRNMTAYLSEDEGATWKYKILLDPRTEVSYPDATEDAAGNIWITYDRERGGFKKSREQALADAREVLLTKITEADIIAGRLVSPQSFTGHIVSKLGDYDGDDFWGENEMALKF